MVEKNDGGEWRRECRSRNLGRRSNVVVVRSFRMRK